MLRRTALVACAGCWLLIVACSGGTAGGPTDDAGTSGSTSASSASSSSGSSGDGGSSSGEAGSPTCTPAEAPAASAPAMEIAFDVLDPAGSGKDGWRTLGWDRDGLCTTAASTDVCKRSSGASSNNQVDGESGIDNAFGKTIVPFLQPFQPQTKFAGYLRTNGAGEGVVSVSLSGKRLDVPIVLAKWEQTGTSATFSAIIPTEAFVSAVAAIAGSISKDLCSGSTLEAIKTSIRQASDIVKDGTQDPNASCDGITIGATVTNIRTATIPVITPGPDPCQQ